MVQPTAPQEAELLESWGDDRYQGDWHHFESDERSGRRDFQVRVRPLMEEPDTYYRNVARVVYPDEDPIHLHQPRDYTFSEAPVLDSPGSSHVRRRTTAVAASLNTPSTAMVVAQLQSNPRSDAPFHARTENGASERPLMVASGVAGMVVGSILLGTIPGILAGAYSAYATGQQGCAGDIARAIGEVALVVREKAVRINQKHKVMDKSQEVLERSWRQAKELDRKYNLIEKFAEFSLVSLKFAWDFVRQKSLGDTRSSRAAINRSSDDAVFSGRYQELQRTPPIVATSY